MTTKSITLRQTSFTGPEREERLLHFVAEGFRTMHVCRHSGSPEQGLLVGRSLFPVLVTIIHRRLTTDSYHGGRSLSQMLQDLHDEGIVDDVTRIGLRRAASALATEKKDL